MLKKYLSALFGSFILIFFISVFLQNNYNSVQAQGMGDGGTSLSCTVQTQFGTDDKQVILDANGNGQVPVAGNDGYVYDNPVNPETDPEVVQFIARPQRYAVISVPPGATYNASQSWQDEGQNLCGTTLQCGTTCKPPIESGQCDGSCNISMNGGQCPRYAGATSFTGTSSSTGTISWGDGGLSAFNPGPTSFPLAHSYANPGNYDAIMNCGNQTCVKRFNVVCQSGGGIGNTPTPLPTASPTPTGGMALCTAPLVCSHPCACNNTSSSFVNAGCSISSSAATNLSGGLGTTVGNSAGQACLPGMVCCQPPSSSNAWFKTKDTSYHEKAALSNPIPTAATAYDGTDTGPCSTPASSYNCHTINSGGLLTAEGNINLSSGVANYPRWSYGNANYNYLGEFTPDTYIQYMRARKETVAISDLDEIQTNKVNYITGDHTVTESDDANMQNHEPFVLLVDDGNLTIDVSTNFNSPNNAMAVIVDGRINIKSSITSMNGIFIASTFDFAYDTSTGSYTSQPLTINGNVISMTDADCLAKRRRSDVTKPTCFFKQDFVNHYLPLWSMFTTRTFSRSSS